MWTWSVKEQRHIWIEITECIWCEGENSDCHVSCQCVCHAIAEGLYESKD